MPELIPFCFDEAMVRTVVREDGPWFVARDVCNVLELEHITNALSSLDEDELTVELLQSGGQRREMKLISESGLYALVFKSRKPQAKAFRRWVTHEVLPAIRKTGSYSQDDGGRKTDIFYHRGPVSPGGLDIRYQLDLTKVVLRPTSTSLRVLQRVTGIDLADMIAELEHPASSLADTLVRDFCQQCFAAAPGERVRLSQAVEALNRWLADLVGHGEKKQPQQLGAELRNLGYTLRKIGGVYWIMDVSMDVNR